MPIGTLLPTLTSPGPNNVVPHVTPSGDIQTCMGLEDVERIIARPPADDDWLELSNYASAQYLLERNDIALDYALRALALERNSSTLLNCALILEATGEFRSARPLVEEAYPTDPENKMLAGNLAEARLRMGDWREGWPLYTYAYAQVGWMRRFLPEWTGRESLCGKRLLIFEGGGIGDTFLFMRWLIRLKSYGAHITYVGHTPIVPLMESQPYVDRVIPVRNQRIDRLDLREFDYFTSILAMGENLDVTVDDVLWRGAYIVPPASCDASLPRSPRVGFCWQAGEYFTPRHRRTLSDAQRDRILHAARFPLVNLQYGSPLPATVNPDISGWSRTAAVISQLDLVITVDTATAHLAGAMNVPVWTILPGASAPLYLLDSARLSLYPSMRLYRNRGYGLDNAVDAVAADLESL